MVTFALVASIALAASGPSADDLASYEEERAKVGRDAEAHVRLALWCESKGLTAERLEHLAIAVATDPANVAARGLLGLVRDGDRWRKPDDLAAKVAQDAKVSAALAEYAGRRAKSPKTADGHWRLALWCEQNGLDAESKAHLTAVVRLDPGRAGAWKKLGCRKVGRRWVTEEQIAARKAEVEARREADKKYPALLASWRAALRGRDEARKFEAEKGLNELKDPRAAASVWKVFVAGAESFDDLARAVQILGQIDAPLASKGLATIALECDSAEVRRAAAETLLLRDPRDFVPELIANLQDELKFEVRPVGGPGMPGALFVEGQAFNRMRVYAPPPTPFLLGSTEGSWATDAAGYEVIRLRGTVREEARVGEVTRITGAEFRHGLAADDPRSARLEQALGPDAEATRQGIPGRLNRFQRGGASFVRDGDFNVDIHERRTDTRVTETEVPIGRIVEEHRRSAAVAQAQLEADLAFVQDQNREIRRRNARVVEVLNNVTGQALPALGTAWRTWWADQRGYAYQEPPTAAKPTVHEDVPLAYQPRPVSTTTRVGGVVSSESTFFATGNLTDQGAVRLAPPSGFVPLTGMHDCFAAGTPVHTRAGSRPIESIEVGDLVLAQDMGTGALAYKPVVAVFKFRPARTLKVSIGGETLVTTAVHRFWRPGRGWVMARDLKPGDSVRTLAGLARVESVEEGVVRSVFNLEVADFADYFVGRGEVLAGDNTLQEARVTPFDGAARSTPD